MKLRIERRGRPRRTRKKRNRAERDADVRSIAQRMPNRREVPIELRHDARAADVIGRMVLTKRISEEQYEAALELRRAVQRMHRVFDVPKADAGALPLDGARRGAPREIGEKVATRWKEEHKRVYHELIIHEGVRVAQMVTRVVVYDQPCMTGDEVDALRRGLKRLAIYYAAPRRTRAYER